MVDDRAIARSQAQSFAVREPHFRRKRTAEGVAREVLAGQNGQTPPLRPPTDSASSVATYAVRLGSPARLAIPDRNPAIRCPDPLQMAREASLGRGSGWVIDQIGVVAIASALPVTTALCVKIGSPAPRPQEPRKCRLQR